MPKNTTVAMDSRQRTLELIKARSDVIDAIFSALESPIHDLSITVEGMKNLEGEDRTTALESALRSSSQALELYAELVNELNEVRGLYSGAGTINSKKQVQASFQSARDENGVLHVTGTLG